MKPLPFPYALNIGTDIVHLPRITRLLTQRPNYLSRFTTRILSDTEQRDFHRRFNGTLPPTTSPSQRDLQSPNKSTSTHSQPITPEITRWLAGRFAAKEAARKAAPSGAASLGWKDVIVRMEGEDNRDMIGSAGGHTAVDGTSRRPEVVYVEGEGGRVAKLSISHDGEYVVATVLAAGHSGQFCPGHAKDSLEEVIQTAISKKMKVFCLTEHMPRHKEDFYPEEIESGQTEEWHSKNEEAYWLEATRLRKKYASQISIIIGFECDWIRPESKTLINTSLSRFPFEFFIGSLHHTLTIPIDYDRPMYEEARNRAGGTDELLFEAYFDEQLDMLQQLRPLVVGHFDLIRLKSDDVERSFKNWDGVWRKVLRNLDFVASYGGMLEINGAALRKGMSEPYPKAEICKEFLARGGRFCLSDDSHGVEQISLNFHRVLEFLDSTGISTVHYLRLAETEEGAFAPDARFPRTEIASISVEEVKELEFWKVA